MNIKKLLLMSIISLISININGTYAAKKLKGDACGSSGDHCGAFASYSNCCKGECSNIFYGTCP